MQPHKCNLKHLRNAGGKLITPVAEACRVLLFAFPSFQSVEAQRCVSRLPLRGHLTALLPRSIGMLALLVRQSDARKYPPCSQDEAGVVKARQAVP